MVADRRNHAATTLPLSVAVRATVRGRDHVSSRVARTTNPAARMPSRFVRSRPGIPAFWPLRVAASPRDARVNAPR